uniref:TPR_REGION domain-containing protein n=1 Tax=Macrostomum lignano TaxID=282301 RepID=A0A1I8IHA5_9PLAT
SLRRRPTRLVSAGTPSSNSSATAAAASATNSATASGPAGLAATRRRAAAAAASPAGQQQQLSARAMKGRWDSIERALSTTVGRRQTVGHLAADMENWVHEREKLARRLDQLNAKRARFERAGQTAGPDWDQLLEQMRNARAQAELAQDNIAECQRSIIELEEQRLPESSALFGRLTSLQEARYLLERLYQLALDRGLSALQRETELRDARANAEAKAKETEQALEMLQIALKQAPVPGLDADDLFFGVVGGGDGEEGDVDGEAAGGGGGAAVAADDDNEDADSLENGEAGGGGSSSKPAVAPRQQQQQQQMFNLGGAATIDSRPRQKRKTATAEELLGLKSAVDMSRSMDEGALAGGALRNNSSESALLPASGARVPEMPHPQRPGRNPFGCRWLPQPRRRRLRLRSRRHHRRAAVGL